MNWTDDDCIVLEAGDYTIGLSDDDLERMRKTLRGMGDTGIKIEYLMNSFPRHTETLHAAMVAKRLVTLAEFETFVRETGQITEAEKDGWGWTWEDGWLKKAGVSWRAPFGDAADAMYRDNAERIPVLQATWNDADAFCAWRSAEWGRAICLPSESEWEVFASRAGVFRADEAGRLIERHAYDSSEAFCDALLRAIDAAGGVHPPGLVWEWTSDWFQPYPGGACNREYGEVYRVLRGGSLVSHPFQKMREYRFRRCPTARSPFYGFRLASD